MSNPISSSNPSYVSALRGHSIGSVQSLMSEIRSMMGEVDQQVNGIQAQVRGTMESVGRERHRVNFLREVSNELTGTTTAGERREFIASAMSRNGIDPSNNPEDRALLAELGLRLTGPGETGGLAGLSHAARSPDRTGVANIIANHQSTLETLTNSMSQDSTRLQALMNRRSEFMSTISQCISSMGQTNSSIIQNIR